MTHHTSDDAAKTTKRLLRIGIYGLTSCAGDQLTILNCEDELLDIFNSAEMKSFLMAKSDNTDDELDIAFVEGSVTSEGDHELLKEIRRKSKTIVAIGGCACHGGPQAGRELDRNWKERLKSIYGEQKFDIPIPMEPKPVSAHVKVDMMIPGCPIDKNEFLSALSRLVKGDTPIAINYPVCVECKYNENECLLFKNQLCLGPVTAAGCNSVCINVNVPCFGCRGPVVEANVASEAEMLISMRHPHFPTRVHFSAEDVTNRAMMYGGAPMAELLQKLREVKK